MEMREQSKIDEKQQQQQHPILYFKGKKARDFPAVARKTATVVYNPPVPAATHCIYLCRPSSVKTICPFPFHINSIL
jgi:hypothetical protein